MTDKDKSELKKASTAVEAQRETTAYKEITDKLTYDKETNRLTTSENTFISTLPDGVTEDDVTKVMAAIGDYCVTSAVAFGDKALSIMEDDKDVEEVNISIPLSGKDTVNHRMKRSRSVTIPGGGGEMTKYGDMRTVVELHGVSTKRGTMKMVSKYFNHEGAEKLSGK